LAARRLASRAKFAALFFFFFYFNQNRTKKNKRTTRGRKGNQRHSYASRYQLKAEDIRNTQPHYDEVKTTKTQWQTGAQQFYQ
jgi:hypothetical protein